jgi:predicted DNA-binding transcriptional regulator AlpA
MPKIPIPDEQPLMTARDVFPALNMSETTGYALIKSGHFPLRVQRIGGRWMIQTRELRDFLHLD